MLVRNSVFRCVLSPYAQPVWGKQAIVATAHKIARCFYHLLKTHTPFHDMGGEEYERLARERELRAPAARAAKLGMSLIESPWPPLNPHRQFLSSGAARSGAVEGSPTIRSVILHRLTLVRQDQARPLQRIPPEHTADSGGRLPHRIGQQPAVQTLFARAPARRTPPATASDH